MAYPLIIAMNPFLLPLILFSVMLFRRQRDTKQVIIKAVVVINLILLLSFEIYFHHFQCHVSIHYHRTNLLLARRVISLITVQNLSCWLDFGTLLNQLRNESISPWDHDSDVSITDPDYSLTSPVESADEVQRGNRPVTPKIKALMDLFQAHAFVATYDSSRHYIQLWLDSSTAGPHVDLWLWIPHRQVNQTILLWSVDPAIRYNPRPSSQIFPLRGAKWLNQSCFIPDDAHGVSEKEYDIFAGHYLRSRTFRNDCVHNLLYARLFY